MGPEMIPIFGMFTGILTTGFFFWGMVQLARGPIGQALARRIQGRYGNADPDLLNEIGGLREQVEYMQQQLMETQERLEFTERLMAQQRQPLIGEGRHE
jgi:hypothetical protein